MWVIAVLASLAVILFFVLWVPLDLVLYADVYGKPRFRLRLSWLFGLVSREITGEKEKPPDKKRAAKGKKKRGRRDTRVIFTILRTKGLLRRLKDLIIKGIFSHLKARDLVADFKIGLGDPADTGFLFALIGPAAAFLGSSHRHQIRLEPSFGEDAVLQGYSRGTIRLRPIRLAPPLLKFAFSLTALRIVKTLISSKWKRRKK